MEISQDLYSQSWRAGYDAKDRYTNAEAAYVATQLTMMVDSDAFMDGWLARRDDIGYEQMQRKYDDLKGAKSETSRDFESISALITLWRNGRMDADLVLGIIQNIVG